MFKKTITLLNRKPHIWLRDEFKHLEQRTGLPPKHAAELIKHGFDVTIEKSTTRIFPNSEYSNIPGINFAESKSFETLEKQQNLYILGLKELPSKLATIQNTHIYFGHCYKYQNGWEDLMGKFTEKEAGCLLDLEFLEYDNSMRVSAFGNAAGFSGMCLGIWNWIHQQAGSKIKDIKPVKSKDEIIGILRSELDKLNKEPEVFLLGSIGRCGLGAMDVCKRLGLKNVLEWNEEDTRGKTGPFKELTEADILVNSIYLATNKGKQVFLNEETLQGENRKLSVFVDVSCDYDNPFNPFPIYDRSTSFTEPVFTQKINNGRDLDIIAIDHLPTFIPKESSEDFCDGLLPHLLTLKDYEPRTQPAQNENQRVWKRAVELFEKKHEELKNLN